MRLFKSLRATPHEASKEKTDMDDTEHVLTTLLHDLREGVMYSFAAPWQLTAESLSAVVPILTKVVTNREYLVLQEVTPNKIVVSDSGRIGQINARTEGVDRPVFVRTGTVFRGQSTQSRTNGTGIVLEPNKESPIDSFCVHATQGISKLSSFHAADFVPRKIEDVLISPFRSQSSVWRAISDRGTCQKVSQCPNCGSSRLIQNYEAELICLQCGNVVPPAPRASPSMAYNSGTSSGQALRKWSFRVGAAGADLASNLEQMSSFNREVKGMLSQVPADLQNQVGIVIVDSGGVLGLEMFDHPDSWRAFSESIVRNYADILARERAGEGLFSLRTERIPEAIGRFLMKAEKLTETVGYKNEISETKMLSGELFGEYTLLRARLIHLVLKRRTA